MNFEIVTLAPFYYIFICALIAAGLTWLLYRKHNFENRVMVRLMAALRFLGLFVLFVLLLAPLVRIKRNVENKPDLLVFFDKTNSINPTDLKNASDEWRKNASDIAQKFKVHEFAFGSDVVPYGNSTLNKSETRMGGIFDFVNENFEGSNLGALVVISDGIHNKGVNPLFKSLNKRVPVYAVGIGDSVMYPDAWIVDLNANTTAFLENEFSVSANLRAFGLKGKTLLVDLYQDGRKIQSVSRQVSENSYFGTADFTVKPSSPGVRRFEVRINKIEGENNDKNNSKNAFVRISDTRRKIAVVYHAPHPDIGAIIRSLEEFGQYEINRFSAAQNLDVNAADIFILHGFASNARERDLVNALIKNGKSIWLVLSSQSEAQFSVFEEVGMRLEFNRAALSDAQAVPNHAFSDFSMDDEFATAVKFWPPLKVPFGKYEMPNVFRPFLMQKIGAVETNYPLMGFSGSGGKRQAWLFGEGLWRWRMRDMQMNGSSEIFDRWIAQTVQYLTTDEVREKFRAFPENPLISPIENAIIFGEYLDQSMGLVNKPNASLVVSGPNGYRKELPFARSGQRYKAELGLLPAGDYSFHAVLATSPALNYQGKFMVMNSDPEQENTRADFDLMRKLADKNAGSFFTPNDMEKLKKELLNRKDIHTIISKEISVREFISLRWLFALLVLFFGAEWFLRKREGSY